MKKKTKKLVIAICVLVVVGIGALVMVKKISPVSWGAFGTFNNTDGVAIGGYDPVSYFTTPSSKAQAAKVGDPANNWTWREVTWHFASAENRELFVADPEKYAPQYGGFCAWAVARGLTADADPKVWWITSEAQHDKLYLLADEKKKEEWIQEAKAGGVKKADRNWAKR